MSEENEFIDHKEERRSLISGQPIEPEKKSADQIIRENNIQDGFSIVAGQLNYAKKPIEQIIKEASELDIDKIAIEVISWAITNVEQYVDNSTKSYQLNLILDTEDEASEELEMTEIRKLQSLYRAIPDDSDIVTPELLQKLIDNNISITTEEYDQEFKSIVRCKELLDKITSDVHDKIRELDEYMLTLYKRLVYYYEMVGISKGKPVIRELEGAVDITKFEYDSFPVSVRVRSPIIENISEEQNDATIETHGETMIKEYTIPEGFILFIELSFRDVHRAASVF